MDPNLVEQLRRQSLWLRNSWLWLLKEKVALGARPGALEVGCGAGHVMEIISEIMDVKGADRDPDMVRLCLEKGQDAAEADACALPFGNGSFDVVYCSFLMLWLEEPVKAVKEMARVSRGWVICLAEPDYGARIDHPPELESAGRALVRNLESSGADPFAGRKLRAIFSEAGLAAEIGVHQGVWPIEKARDEYLRQAGTVGGIPKETVEAAYEQGSLLQYNPVFYALAKK